MKIKKYKSNQTSYRSLDWSRKKSNDNFDFIVKLYNKGSLFGSLCIRENWIFNLVVNPKFRFNGYGKKLIKEAEKIIKKKYKTVNLTPQDNDESLRLFYSKLGYSGFNENTPGYEEEDKTWWIMSKCLK